MENKESKKKAVQFAIEKLSGIKILLNKMPDSKKDFSLARSYVENLREKFNILLNDLKIHFIDSELLKIKEIPKYKFYPPKVVKGHLAIVPGESNLSEMIVSLNISIQELELFLNQQLPTLEVSKLIESENKQNKPLDFRPLRGKKVFISGKKIGLKKERNESEKLFEKLGAIVWRFENVSTDLEARKQCRIWARTCDLYIGIYGGSYGEIPEGESLSATEIEFQEAKNANKTMLVFIKDEKKDKNQKQFIQRIRNWNSGVMAPSFKDEKDLIGKIIMSLEYFYSNFSTTHKIEPIINVKLAHKIEDVQTTQNMLLEKIDLILKKPSNEITLKENKNIINPYLLDFLEIYINVLNSKLPQIKGNIFSVFP